MKVEILGGATAILYMISMEESKIFSSDSEIREMTFTNAKIDCKKNPLRNTF